MNPTRKGKRRRVLLAVLASLLLLSGGTYTGVNATAAKPDIQFQISPASQSLERGQTAIYTVTLTSTGGFAGTVGLSVSGLPSGSISSLLPATPTLAASDTGSTVTSVLTVTTAAGTPVGPSTLKVTGTSGKVSGSVTAELTVEYPRAGFLSMSAAPAAVTLAPGSAAAYAIQLVRTDLSDTVTLSVSGALPSGMTVVFSPSASDGTSSTLQVTTTSAVPDDTYTLHLVASGNDANKETRYAYASVRLVIKTTGRSFTSSGNLNGLLAPGAALTISGNLQGRLAPGRALPLALNLNNPSEKSLSVMNLSVSLQRLSRTSFAISHSQPCSIGDFAVVQYSGPYPLAIPGSSTMSLSELGVLSGQWPQIQFINRPANQDGCKGATLALSYSGSGLGT
jgi:hypothetical protein